MHYKPILAVTLAAILILSVTAIAFAQEDRFSARVLAKGKKSNVLILFVNSSKSTKSVHEFEVIFTQGKPIVAIARGWDAERSGDTMTFTTKRSDLGPGGRAIFIIKVSDPASSAFQWSANGKDGNGLQSGQITKIRVKEPPTESVIPKVTAPEINVNKVKASLGEQITVTGKGYSATSTIIIYIDQQEVGRSTSDSSGTFNSVVLIPNNVATGLHLIRAVDAANKSSVIQILLELPAGSLPPLEGGKLVVRTDKQEYLPGELVRITGSAVLETPVSLQIVDPKGGIVCGANPQVNNKTLLWDATCVIPSNAFAGKYTIEAKQIIHRTTAVFNVQSTTTNIPGAPSPGGEPGEDPGSLLISTDKETYKVGDVAKITITGARSESLLDVIIDGPGAILKADRKSANQAGSVTFDYPLSGSESIGIWKITAKQMDAAQKKLFTARKQFEVVAP